MTYDPRKFWSKLENPNTGTKQDTLDHILFIYNSLYKKEHILDFGPGTGRMLPAYRYMKSVTGYDITDAYKLELYHTASQFPFKFHLDIENDIKPLPYKNKQFDATICVSVLMHQLPEHIEMILSELARVSEQVICISWSDQKHPSYNTEICYNYNYETLCNKNNLQMLYYEIKPTEYKQPQAYFVYQEK